MKKINAVKGMNDLLPTQSQQWLALEHTIMSLMQLYGYQYIRTPIVEYTHLFQRGIGEVTDIVEKEMYSFIDALNQEALTLRPENTAAVVRAAIEHHLTYTGGQRLWYCGPMFRHERPQQGRYRQFHQVGAETLGFVGPDVDAELILLSARLWKKLGISLKLEINCLGQPQERQRHRHDLVAYFEKYRHELDEDTLSRLQRNPLRLLDSKNPALQPMLNHSPQLINYLGTDSLKYFETLQNLLAFNGIGVQINPRLVRGLDYYNLTVFEWVGTDLGAQATVCAGGRYDYLFEQLGGKATPACGWALGLERLLSLCQNQQIISQCDVYCVLQHERWQAHALRIAEQLRDHGLSVTVDAHQVSVKAQLKRANQQKARFCLLMMETEMSQNKIIVKQFSGQDFGGQQVTLALTDIDSLLQLIQNS